MRRPGEGDWRRDDLRLRVLALMQGSPDAADPGEVEALALDLLRYQASANVVYGRLVASRGLDPRRIRHWWDFPPVPVRGFRESPAGPPRAPYIGDPAVAEAVFLTSGTTGGAEARGVHRVRDLSLYHASLLAWAREGFGWDGQPVRVLAILPAPDARPDSSLSHMAGVLKAAWDDGGGGFFVDAEGVLDLEALESALADAAAKGSRAYVLSTAFALVHWLDLRAGRPPHSLPPGSKVMETGGFKGRTREVPRAELYRCTAAALGLAEHALINEYGMTEMLSQFYDALPARAPILAIDARLHYGPPWVRTRVLDPVDLSPVPPGTPGLLAHLDLANLDAAAYLLTEDLGVMENSPVGSAPSGAPLELSGAPLEPRRAPLEKTPSFPSRGAGFRILGRHPDSVPRGCSLSMEAWLEATGG